MSDSKAGEPYEKIEGVKRRDRPGRTSQCLCSKCEKWSDWGCIYGDGSAESPYFYRCPNCLLEET